MIVYQELMIFGKTAVVVSTLVFILVVGNCNSDTMGNKEFRDGFFLVIDRNQFTYISTDDAVRVVFLLYHMKSDTASHTELIQNRNKITRYNYIERYYIFYSL